MQQYFFFQRARYQISPKNDLVAKYSTFESYLDAYLDKVNKSLKGDPIEVVKRHMDIYHKDEASTLLTAGLYSLHLPRWTQLFGSKKLLILNGENLLHDPGKEVTSLISS